MIKDCTHNGSLTKTYSQRDYDEALANLPADVDEYGDCRQIIRDAQLAAAGGGGGSGSGPAGAIPGISAAEATPKTAAERAGARPGDVQRGRHARADPRRQRRQQGARARGVPFSSDGLGSGLPTPVIVVLTLLGLAALVGAGVALRPRIKRVLARGKT